MNNPIITWSSTARCYRLNGEGSYPSEHAASSAHYASLAAVFKQQRDALLKAFKLLVGRCEEHDYLTDDKDLEAARTAIAKVEAEIGGGK